MKLKELKIEISEELLESLKEKSAKNNISHEEMARQLLETALQKKEDNQTRQMPSVALIKGSEPLITSAPGKNTPSMQKECKNPDPKFFGKPKVQNLTGNRLSSQPVISHENLQRRKAIESEMKEISLLIETAESEEKKQDYLMRYASLAAELEALL
ncbi:MAG: hypothetical protein Kow0029_10140 [Candidatus Rifleibacteriota bacterium]